MATHICIERGHPGPCYWLAKLNPDQSIQEVDGCHSTPEGVAKAAKLHHRIFGAEDGWFIVKIEPLPPWGNAEINEQSAAECAALVQNHAR
jgi:hypothetical protein